MARMEGIIGPMFSGKSEEMITRLRVAAYAEKNLLLVRPRKDNRSERNIFDLADADNKLGKYEKLIKAVVNSPAHLKELVSSIKPDLLAIDEVQFIFDYGYLDFVLHLLDKNKENDFTVIISGLNLDAEGRTFGLVSDFIIRADDIRLKTAICTKCKCYGAIFTQKISGSRKQIEVGDEKMYTVRCRVCFVKQSEMPLD